MDYTRNMIGAARKAMEDTVLPAVTQTGQSRAVEQATLVAGILDFAEQRIEHVADHEALQLRESLRLAGRIVQLGEERSESRAKLQEAEHHAMSVLEEYVPCTDRRTAKISLDAAIRGYLLELYKGAEMRQQARAIVLEETELQIEADRAWLAPMGFEPDPESLMPLEELFTRE